MWIGAELSGTVRGTSPHLAQLPLILTTSFVRSTYLSIRHSLCLGKLYKCTYCLTASANRFSQISISIAGAIGVVEAKWQHWCVRAFLTKNQNYKHNQSHKASAVRESQAQALCWGGAGEAALRHNFRHVTTSIRADTEASGGVSRILNKHYKVKGKLVKCHCHATK